MGITRDDIQNVDDMQMQEVPVPEWKGSVWVKSLPSGEVDAYHASMMDKESHADKKKLATHKAGLLVRCLYNEVGEKLFNNGDVELLASKNAKVIGRLYKVAAEMSGLTPESAEDAEKN